MLPALPLATDFLRFPLRTLLVLVLLASSGPAQAQNQPLIDSLQRAATIQADTAKAWTLVRLAWEYRPYDQAKALHLNRQALALATRAGHVEQQGFCWMAVGNVYNFHEQAALALAAYRTAEPLLQRAANGRLTGRLGHLHYNWGLLLQGQLSDYAGAVPHLLLAVRAYERLGYRHEQTKSLNAIANCLYHEHRTPEAFTYYRKAEAVAERSGSLEAQLTVMNDFYSCYLSLYAREQKPLYLRLATQNLQRGVALIRQHPQQVSPQYLPTFLTNLAEGCVWNKEFDRARELLGESIALTKPLEVSTLLAHNYSILAALEAEQRRPGPAKAAVAQASRYLAACNLEDQALIAQRLQKAYAQLANWQSAHQWLARHLVLRDSLAARTNAQTVRRLTLQYEVEKKDLNIRALLQQATYQRWLLLLTIGLALLLLAAAAAFLRSSRLRRRVAEQQLLLSEEQAVVARQEQLLAQQQQQQLRQEVDYKHRELTTATLNLERKNELLLALRKELERVPETGQQLKPAFRLINQNLQLDDDIDQFRLHFEGVHPHFFQTLRGVAALSTTEVRYCAYLRMGLSTKEIANLLNIEPHSVRVGKHRLKQKLQLTKDDDLEQFIKNI